MSLALASTDADVTANLDVARAGNPAEVAQILAGKFPLLPDDDWRRFACFRRHAWSRREQPFVFGRDGRVCRYCGRADRPLSLDHILPRALGGGDDAENLVVACIPCNSRKGARTPGMAGMALRPVPVTT